MKSFQNDFFDTTFFDANLTWPNVTWHNLIWPNLTSPNLFWPNLTWPNLTWPILTWPILTWPILTLLDPNPDPDPDPDPEPRSWTPILTQSLIPTQSEICLSERFRFLSSYRENVVKGILYSEKCRQKRVASKRRLSEKKLRRIIMYWNFCQWTRSIN